MNSKALFFIALSSIAVTAQAQVTMAAKSGFGVGGFVSQAAFGGGLLSTSNTERSLAYNKATGNVLVVSRNAGTSMKIVNGTTGAATSQALTGISGGTFAANTVGVSSDGQVFVTNMVSAMGGTSFYKVYRYANEAGLAAAAANVGSFQTLTGTVGARLGDDLDVVGTGNNVTMVGGYNTSGSGLTGSLNGYTVSTWNGTSISASHVQVTGGVAGQFRTGVTFGANVNEVIGTQGSPGINFSTYSGTSGTMSASVAGGDSSNERCVDYVEFNGHKLLATLEAHPNAGVGNAEVRVYEVSGTGLTLWATGTTLTGATLANGNGAGGVAWGASSGNNISLYAMSTNNGIQAFDINVVPEPGSMLALGLGAVALMRRRKV
ncbi:MAG: PEP-CTERM sorting domain-containing protein [Armatimonadetes bacterium]|nr:PEP-CTERM sorting domain-containing protein [Armatimonadota bacterium]